MPEVRPARVAIVDYGMGNLFSVQQACTQAGLAAAVTAEPHTVLEADAAILPGVGAFGDAMAELTRRDLVAPLRDAVASGKPVVGICLGMQLLMSESYEFGRHKGLALIDGEVVRLQPVTKGARTCKVPQVGWNQIHRVERASWEGSLLDGVRDGAFMYFVHSFYVKPMDPTVVLATTRYGSVEFCCALRWRSIFACQFHPERSGQDGLALYRNLAAALVAHHAEVKWP